VTIAMVCQERRAMPMAVDRTEMQRERRALRLQLYQAGWYAGEQSVRVPL
jgi:hypothetical protein